jgi:sugar lactone lactonase YvrE
MKTIKPFLVILLTALVSACGGGGGADASGNQSPSSDSSRYVVSTLSLNNPLTSPSGVSLDMQGNLYISDTGANLIRKISNVNNSTVTSFLGIAGGGGTDYSSCNNSNLYSPYGIVVDSSGHLYVAERGKPLIRYSVCTSSSSTSAEYGTDAVGLTLSSPSGIALFGSNLYVADTGNHKIRLITNNGAGSGSTATLAGTSNGYVNAISASAAFSQPTGVAVDSSRNVFVTDTNNCAIRMISTAGVVSTFAGSGPNNSGTGPSSCGSSDGTTTSARFNYPTGIAIDGSNNLYVADTVNNQIRRITPQGVVTTIAGSGISGSSDGIGSSATFNVPTGIVVDASGNIFVVDSGSRNIRKISVIQ